MLFVLVEVAVVSEGLVSATALEEITAVDGSVTTVLAWDVAPGVVAPGISRHAHTGQPN